MKFIDLFAGLGGFHFALRRLGHECVFASEIEPTLQELYQKNCGMTAAGDIQSIKVNDIPAHDVLCAGFPCQPFSKAGEQEGLKCPRSGDLFDAVTRTIRHHKPKFIILENVANLEHHDNGRTWKNRLRRRLVNAGYDVQARCLSPHSFGIPQARQRFFIVASRAGLNHFSWPEPYSQSDLSIRSILDESPAEATKLSQQAIDCLNAWQGFLDRYPAAEDLPGFPIWSMEFGATYPYENETPHAAGIKNIGGSRGCHGKSLSKLSSDERVAALPSYAREERKKFPGWKIDFIKQNRELYARHQSWIDDWKASILQFPQSLQKFEWHCKGEERNVWKTIIQFRASGVRLKRPTTAPSLVAMTTTQVPIIGWEKRYMTPRECSRLQSMRKDELKFLPDSNTRAFKALGNSVNVDVVELVASRLLSEPLCAVSSRRSRSRNSAEPASAAA